MRVGVSVSVGVRARARVRVRARVSARVRVRVHKQPRDGRCRREREQAEVCMRMAAAPHPLRLVLVQTEHRRASDAIIMVANLAHLCRRVADLGPISDAVTDLGPISDAVADLGPISVVEVGQREPLARLDAKRESERTHARTGGTAQAVEGGREHLEEVEWGTVELERVYMHGRHATGRRRRPPTSPISGRLGSAAMSQVRVLATPRPSRLDLTLLDST